MGTIGAQFDPTLELLENKHSVQVIIKPTIPDNEIHWDFFESDEHIAMFIHKSREFADQL